MSKIEEIKAQRASTKGCMTRIKNIIESKGDNLTAAELECRLGILESYFKQFLSYQTAIEKLAPDDAAESQAGENIEELYCAAKAKILTLMSGQRKSMSFHEASFATARVVELNHLPKLKLPQFAGKYSEFPNFINTFSILIDKNETLSQIEKFNHLVSCLSGSALRAIKAFEITEINYKKALDQLKKRYDNKYIIFQEHITDLFNLPKVPKNSAEQLRAIVDNASAHLSALLSLGSVENIVHAMMIYLVNSKLDFDSQCKWEDKLDTSKLPSWEEYIHVLNRRCQYLESRDAKSLKEPSVSSPSTSRSVDRKKEKRTGSNATSLAVTQSLCEFCKQEGHPIYKCSKFLERTVLSRFSEVKKRALCINCLSKGHSVKKCPATKCRVCQMPHHTLLHRYAKNTSSISSQTPSPANPVANKVLNAEASPADSSSFSSLLSSNETTSQVFLAAAVVKVQDKYGNFHMARALLDSASQLNFISESLAQTLRLKRERVELSINGIGQIPTTVRWSTQTSISSRINDFETNLSLYIIPHITGLQPEKKISIENWNIPSNITLADPLFHQPQKVDLLIGADTFFNLLCVGQIKLHSSLPILQKTTLGWIVSGRYSSTSVQINPSCNVASASNDLDCTTEDENLTAMVERFWKEESIDSDPIISNQSPHPCETQFKDTVRRLPDGRFMVKLPFKEPPELHLGHSYEIAYRRFMYLERRLSKDSELKSKYAEFLQEYFAAGHMEIISNHDLPHPHYFMPHRCVLRPDSSTTKLRVVFDASCRTSTNTSLNDILMIGPVIQNDLFSILSRFRIHKFALTADIASMYRQILVYPEDRNYQLILWREQPTDDLKVFKLNTVTYGTASAPFLATRCLQQLAEDNYNKCSKAARIIESDFYMDDLLTGADTRDELFELRDQIDGILNSGQFSLRKWYSNDTEFLDQIPESEREKALQFDGSDIVKPLGMIWQPSSDEFRFQHIDRSSDRRITKRSILSDTARLFDPLGLINPIVVRAKIFLQEIWLHKLDWDESLPQSMEYSWREFITGWKLLKDIRIPRLILPAGRVSNVEFHGFADASARAYGCCVYIRSIQKDGLVAVQLLAAKSRVAPIRKVKSLPCLELCAALLLAKLTSKIQSSFPTNWNATYLWTDSEIVLDWLASHASNWKTYVANRVAEIQELTTNAFWRHVSSKDNPADIVSRGIAAGELSSSIWFSGPSFLQKTEEFWPVVKERHVKNLDLPERRKIASVLQCSTAESFLNIVYSISDFTKNVRRFAFILRFYKNLLAKRKKAALTLGHLSASEIDDAFLRLIWRIQQHEFESEIRALERGKELPSNSVLNKLSPFLDDSSGVKLLRVGGRLKHADISYQQKFPILLPRSNDFVKSYVRFLHFKNFHAGPQALVALIQERFWMVNARNYTRNVVRTCIHCFRYRPRLAQQIMGNLPAGRVNISSPFTHCGVDFFGPFQTTYKLRGKSLTKSYVAIFICFVTKAVHMEVVSDLSSEAFIAALKRFVSRRNLCQHLYCDNGTNFVGARRQLQEFHDAFLNKHTQADIARWCSTNSIEFHHIPPRSPHFGGLWEAAVKAAKSHLFRTLKNTLLTYEELNTVTTQIEAILNSRPITPLPADPNEDEALTPAHFLNQAPIRYFPEPSIPSNNLSYIRRWQRITALTQFFWNRWSKEYLSQLQQKGKWQNQYPNVEKDMVVLIHQEDTPPFKWKLGRIIDTTPGSDDKVRVVTLKTSTGIIQRSIQKIAPLPQDED